jgi:hypothetical protein
MGKQNREVAQDQPAILYLNNMCYSRIKSQESKDSSGGEELMCAWKEIVVPVSRSVNCHHVIRAAKQQMPKLHTNMLCKASCRSSAQVAKGASSSQAQGAVNGSSAATRLQVAKVASWSHDIHAMQLELPATIINHNKAAGDQSRVGTSCADFHYYIII